MSIHQQRNDTHMISSNCKYLEQISFPGCTSLNLNHSSTIKHKRDGGIIGYSLFGVAIKNFAFAHDSTRCNVNSSMPYMTGTIMGMKHIEEATINGLHQVFFQDMLVSYIRYNFDVLI